MATSKPTCRGTGWKSRYFSREKPEETFQSSRWLLLQPLPLRPPLSRWFPSTCSLQAASATIIHFIHTCSSSQPWDWFCGLSVTPRTYLCWSSGSCAEKIGGEKGRENCSVPSPYYVLWISLLGPFISEIKSSNSSKSGVGWISYPYDAKYTSYKCRQEEWNCPTVGSLLQPPLFPFPHLSTFLSCTPPILCALLLKFCV